VCCNFPPERAIVPTAGRVPLKEEVRQMPIFQVTPTGLKAPSETTFDAEDGRKDIQRLLRVQINVID
jgi:hypothetical protein